MRGDLGDVEGGERILSKYMKMLKNNNFKMQKGKRTVLGLHVAINKKK